MNPREISHKLVAAGAVLTIPGEPPLDLLVGHLEWLDDGRIFWFAAHGDTSHDGHLLDFDLARAPHKHAVEFRRARELVGYLTSIEEADVDAEVWRETWDAWREIAADRAAFIAETKAELVG